MTAKLPRWARIPGVEIHGGAAIAIAPPGPGTPRTAGGGTGPSPAGGGGGGEPGIADIPAAGVAEPAAAPTPALPRPNPRPMTYEVLATADPAGGTPARLGRPRV